MDFKNQYLLIQSSRGVLLDYCPTITPEHLLIENSTFGRGSIRNLLVHNAYTYQYWLGAQALQKEIAFPDYDTITGISDIRHLFQDVDALVAEFIAVFSNAHLKPLTAVLRENTFDVTPLELFTHVLSHEFHHKGQVLSLSRHLGYVPVDTDVIR